MPEHEKAAYEIGLKTLSYFIASDHDFSVEYMAMAVVQDALREYKKGLDMEGVRD